jgi:RNA polymerase sigma-70 factor, ECF subfamily
MSEKLSGSPREPKPGTLGALLYAEKGRTPPLEDEWAVLVRSIAAGDQLALHALYERAHRLVFTLTLRITNSRQMAEELTVDVFHHVWQQAAKYDPEGGTVLGWILNHARSRAIDRLRFEGRQKRADPRREDWTERMPAPDSEEAIALEQQAQRLRKALTLLTPDEHRAIEAAYFSELTYVEVAARLNEPLGTIKTRIRSGLAKLREALSGEVKP